VRTARTAMPMLGDWCEIILYTDRRPLVNVAAHTAIWPSFAKMMCRRFKYDKIVSTVSGTDAVESACKIARTWGIKVKGIPAKNVLVLGVSGCFHGLSMSMWASQDPGPKRDGV
jgi:ornithine--oxo-acid transaminase